VPVIAHLTPLVGSDEPTLPEPLRIIADDVTLGSDPLHATLVINDRSIEGVHARIRHEGNTFVISDNGSVAGTWVNYQAVPEAGTQLEHADIIHLGGVVFRFNLAEPGLPRKILVTTTEPDR
jgi:predicted component of type VI protein secretion system